MATGDQRNPENYGPILTTAQVATMLDLNPQTVQQMAKDGRLPAHRLPGARKYLFFQQDVIDFLRGHAVQPERAAETVDAAER